MDRTSVIRVLKDAEPLLRSRGVAHAAVFGSVARNEARADSDIDIMVEIAEEAATRMGVYEYVGIVNAIEDMFTVPVDVSDRAQLKPHVRPSAERDAVFAF